MIFITAKFPVLPQYADRWPELSQAFTQACRDEPGCRFFDWSRSLADPNEYVLVEAFADADAGAAHVNSSHFKQAQRDLPQYLQATPRIISQDLEQDGWDALGEFEVR